MRKNKGITLIALIITIIIMLILVAVSVNILIKSKLIGIAEKATDKYKTVSEEEAKGGAIEIGGNKYDSIDDYISGKSIMSAAEVAKNAPKVYGCNVTNYNANNLNYKIFYSDGNNIFLIAENPIGSYYWEYSSPVREVSDETMQKFMATGYGMKMAQQVISDLLCTDNWTDYLDNNYAAQAVGSPTIEMFVASWNAKGYAKLNCKETNNYGYVLKLEDSRKELGEEVKKYNDELYFTQDEYWLASPIANSMDPVYVFWITSDFRYETPIHFSRAIARGDGSAAYGSGIRPVILLKDETQVIYNGDGTVTLK